MYDTTNINCLLTAARYSEASESSADPLRIRDKCKQVSPSSSSAFKSAPVFKSETLTH